MLAKPWRIFDQSSQCWYYAIIEEAGTDWVRLRYQDYRSPVHGEMVELGATNLGCLIPPAMT